jgi:hypothetical protein
MDLTQYSLALIKDNKIIFSSKKSRLRPIVMCVMKCNESNCTLFDKVVGLAAARIIIHSKRISKVITNVISEPALSLLKSNKIEVEAKKKVPNILNDSKTGVCPMEQKAKIITDNSKFYKTMKNLIFSN